MVAHTYSPPVFSQQSDSFNEQKGSIKKIIENKVTFQVGFYGYNTINSTKKFDKQEYFSNYHLIVCAYSKSPKIYDMEIITTEEVIDKLDMFQSRFGKIRLFFQI